MTRGFSIHRTIACAEFPWKRKPHRRRAVDISIPSSLNFPHSCARRTQHRCGTKSSNLHIHRRPTNDGNEKAHPARPHYSLPTTASASVAWVRLEAIIDPVVVGAEKWDKILSDVIVVQCYLARHSTLLLLFVGLNQNPSQDAWDAAPSSQEHKAKVGQQQARGFSTARTAEWVLFVDGRALGAECWGYKVE